MMNGLRLFRYPMFLWIVLSLQNVFAEASPDNAAPEEAKEARQIFSGMPPFKVIPRKKTPGLHPCGDCHAWAESDPAPRPLKEPHNGLVLKHGLHGKGEFWCFTCHHLDDDGGLRTLEDKKLAFDEAYLLCAQCHSRQARDWYFGAHGKRMENWQGERKILNCTVCHYQHAPAPVPRKPMPPPPVRTGLAR